MAPFDPYHNWLGIPPHEQPASFYRLLGLVLFESNPEVIAQAADRQSMHIASFQNGPNGNYCGQLMGEIGQAAACLLDPQQKASYDHHLQESLSARGERSVMAAPPPPSAFGMADPMGGFNGNGSPGPYGQPPMPSGGWSDGGMSQPMPQSNAFGQQNGFGQPNGFGQQSGEMPMPQFNLPPAMGAPGMPDPMGYGGMNGMNSGQPPMPNFLPGPPSPMMPGNSMMPNPTLPHPMHSPSGMQSHGVPQPMSSPMPISPTPVSRGPQPAPFPKAPRPIPVASRAGNSAPSPAAGAASAATVAPPQPPPAAPPRPADELADLASTPIRRRFKKKRNQVPSELIVIGVVLASAALAFVIYAFNNGTTEKHGYDQIGDQTPPVTTAADAAAKDLIKAITAKDSSKKTNGSAASGDRSNPDRSNPDKKSRSITTVGDRSKRTKPVYPAGTTPVENGPANNSDPDEIVSPNHFGPPPHGLIEETGTNDAARHRVHVDGPPEDDTMERVLGDDPKK